VAGAIVKKAADAGCDPAAPARFDYFPGKGVVALGPRGEITVGTPALLSERGVKLGASHFEEPSAVLVARGSKLLGRIEIGDVLRRDAKDAIAALRSMGLRTILLTGDTDESARRVA